MARFFAQFKIISYSNIVSHEFISNQRVLRCDAFISKVSKGNCLLLFAACVNRSSAGEE